MTDSIRIATDTAFTGTATDLAAFPVPSKDRFELTKTSTDIVFDALNALGHAGAALPSNNTALPAAGLVNVANDSPLAIPAAARGAATAARISVDPTFLIDGNGRGGIDFAGGSGKPLLIAKAAVNAQDVGNPVVEGFKDFLMSVWAKPNSIPAGGADRSMFGFGALAVRRVWGFRLNANGGFVVAEGQTGNSGTVTAGVWVHLAAHYAFNTGTGAITINTWKNGVPQLVNGAHSATTANLTADVQTTMRCQIGQGIGGAVFDGVIPYASRIFTNIAGHVLDPATLVAAEYAATKGPIAGL